MNFNFPSLSQAKYKIAEPERIETPRLLLFREKMENNIRRIEELLINSGAVQGLKVLCPHVKTHKSHWVTQRLMESGIGFFKTTPNEVEMLAKSGGKKIFIAYPLMPAVARRMAEIAAKHRDIQWFVQAGRKAHADYLMQAAAEHGIIWNILIDLDVGMHRTGIPPQEALAFYHVIEKTEGLRFAGLHAYDGHNNFADAAERRSESCRSMAKVVETVKAFEQAGIAVPIIVAGGTPSFLPDWEYLSSTVLTSEIYLSPGTWTLFDSKDHALMPEAFEIAALILAQVMDKIDPQTFTLNLGHKRWAVDGGAIEQFSIPGMKALRWNEEHTVVAVPTAMNIEIGDYVLIAPRHVCSTINLWEYFTVIGAAGEIEMEVCKIDARNR